MSTLHEFHLILLNQLEDIERDIIDEFVIDDYFIDYVDDQIGYENNKIYKVPAFSPANEAKKTDTPNTLGIDIAGMTLFTYHSSQLLVETFEQWKVIAEKLPPKYNYEDIRTFDRNEIVMNLNKAIEISKKLNGGNYFLYHIGI